MTVCPPFWSDDLSILWREANEFFPFTARDRRCTAAALNSLTRFAVYLSVLFAVIRVELIWLLVGVVVAAFSAATWTYMQDTGAVREQFASSLTEAPIKVPADGDYTPDIIGSTDRTSPSAANPFMNVLLTEISDNPYREPAKNVACDAVRNELDLYFQTMFASDPGDVFQKTQNQRIWVTQPSTTIPNDQGAFADWLYRVPGQTCKEGNQAACTYYGTGADALPWRSIQKLT